jgi:hypothetical protein
MRSTPERAVSLGTAIDFRACRIPPKAIVVSQKTRPNPVAPKSANEDSFFLCGRARARIVVMVKEEDPS